MPIIRREQYRAMAEARAEIVDRQLIVEIDRRHEPDWANLSGAAKNKITQVGRMKARAYGFGDWNSVRDIVILVHRNPGFDLKQDARSILSATHMPAPERIEALYAIDRMTRRKKASRAGA